MKKIKITLTAIIFTFIIHTNTVQSQELITPDKVSTEQLKGILENAYMEIIKSTDLFVKFKDNRTLYLDVYKGQKYISLSVTYTTKESVSEQDLLNYVNRMNTEIVMLTSRYNKKRRSITFKYYIWLFGGIQPKTIVNIIKNFQIGVDLCVKKGKEKNVF